MKVNRRRGLIRMQFDEVEAGILATLLDDLAEVLELLDPTDPVYRRLYPAGYRDDAEAAAEFRELTEDSLRESRAVRLGQCRAMLPEGGGQLELDAEDAERWLAVLNDLRLALGTRLGVTEEDEPVIDPEDPSAQTRAVYYWLTALQDSLVLAAMG